MLGANKRKKKLEQAGNAPGQTKFMYGKMSNGAVSVPFFGFSGGAAPTLHTNSYNYSGAKIHIDHYNPMIGNSDCNVGNHSTSNQSNVGNSSNCGNTGSNERGRFQKKRGSPSFSSVDVIDLIDEEDMEALPKFKKLRDAMDKKKTSRVFRKEDEVELVVNSYNEIKDHKPSITDREAYEMITTAGGPSRSTAQRYVAEAKKIEEGGPEKVDKRQADIEFDSAVQNKLWYKSMVEIAKTDTGDSLKMAAKVYNITYSYEMIRIAMFDVRDNHPRFKDQTDKWYHESRFSDKSIHGW